MFGRVAREVRAWIEANTQCRRAKAEWEALSERYLGEVIKHFSARECLHMRHTAFRINGLMYLYAKLRRTSHNTSLGVLCGIITHLLDYFYDHSSPDEKEITLMERIMRLEAQPSPQNPLHCALYKLTMLAWPLVANPALVIATLNAMLATQQASIAQNQNSTPPAVTDKQLALLTMAKGHHSLCLYFSIANADFTAEEAAHLVTFGHYMQYMDDLEDFYEDRSEGRASSLSTVRQGLKEADHLLIQARSELAQYYNRPAYDYHFVLNKVLVYHHAIRFACVMRECTRMLPRFFQKLIFSARERLSSLIPFIYLAPID